jgi:hypothetical protein
LYVNVATPLLPVVADCVLVAPFAFVMERATGIPDAATPPLVTVVEMYTVCMLV